MGGPGQRFDFSPLATAGVSYRLTDRVTVRADAGYLGYRKGLPLNLAFSSAISIPRQSGSLSAQLPFLSAGIRVYPVRSSTSRPRLYFEALPALWIARWRERFEIGETYDLGGNYYPARTGDDAFTMLDPGFTAGVGFLGPLAGRTKLDLGVRYLFSIGAGRRELGQYSSGDFEGLRQLAFAMSVQAPL